MHRCRYGLLSFLHNQMSFYSSSECVHHNETLRAGFLWSAWVKCPAKAGSVQQRTKQRGISVPPFSSCTAAPCNTGCNQTPSVTHNTTKHSSAAMLLKQTPTRRRGALKELRRRMWRRPRTRGCLCWTAREWETHGTRSPCFPYPS